MKRCLKRYQLALLILLSSATAFSQSLTGPTSVNSGGTYQYVYSDDALVGSPNWIISSGSLSSSSQSGTNYYANIQWSGSGSGSVTFRDGSTTLATLGVTISGLPGAPGVTDGSTCGPGTVVLYATTGGGGTSVRWYTGPTKGTYLGEGNSYTTPSLSTTTTYYATTYNSSTGLYSTPRTAVIAYVYPVPGSSFSVTGGGTMCSGGSGFAVGLNGSESGVTYQLKLNGSNIGSSVSGTGSSISFGILSSDGNYTVVGTNGNGCPAQMSGSATITVNPLPTMYSVTGGGAYCSDQSGVAVGLNGSQSGVSYQLKLNGVDNGSPVSGTGSTISFGNKTTAGSYTVVATNSTTGCSATMSGSVAVTINTAPTVYTVAGGGIVCSTGVSVTLSGSQTGVTYQLKINGTNSGSTVAGTNAALTWSNQTTAGSYTVVATHASNGCIATMSSSATITVYSLPTAYTVAGGGAFCASGGSVSITLSGSQSGVNYQLKLGGSDVQAAKAGTGSGLTWTSINTAGTYTVVATNPTTTCTNTMSGNATATSNSASVGGTASPSTAYFTSGSGTVTLSGHTGSVLRWEYYTGSSWITVSPSNTTTTLNYTSITTTTSYRAVVQSGVCAAANSNAATITIYPTPVATFSQQFITYGGTTTLSTVATGTYKWKRNGSYISGATAQNYLANELGDYQVEVTQGGAVGTSAAVTIKPITGGTNQNLHSVTNILQAGVTNSTNVYTLALDKISQTIDYQDGYGRTFQVVGVGQSPDSKDVVIPTGYSSQGLVEKSYLPYVATTRDGLLKTNAIRGTDFQYNTSDQYQFYQTTPLIATDGFPYAVKVLAPSPIANLREQGAPGSDWQPGNGHTIKNDLILNAASQVRYWKPDGTTSTTYAANSLAVSQVTDENGNKVRTFTDKLGRTVLKQVWVDDTLEGTYTNWLETYYIYDEYNRLKYILPPKALKVLTSGGTFDANLASVAELIHKFTYDPRGRLVEKKVPSAAVQYIVYDKLDRVALTQDGNLRSVNKWNFVKYDAFNRPVYAGIYVNTTQTTRPTVQALFDALDYNVVPYYEIEQVNVTYQGYSNQQFPTTNLTVLTANYYDHYDFDRNATADYSYDAVHLSGQEPSAVLLPRGLPTGSKRVVFDAAGAATSTWLINVVFYDKFDRAIQTIANNHLYTTVADKTTIIYDFAGKALKSKTTHYQNVSTSLYFVDRLEYDHAGRMLKTYRQINTDPEKLLVQYVYNKLGQVIDKKLHNISGNTFLQSVDYRYNIRGWLKSINNAQLTSDAGTTNDDTDDYFGMELVYNTVESGLGNTQYYNGNISATKWKGPGTTGAVDQRSYKYVYDKSDRLKTATFQAHTGTAWTKEANTLNENMTYDHNGNIKTLLRNQNQRGNIGITITSTAQTIDNLTYSYASNLDKLTQVEDSALGSVGFNDPVHTSTEIAYNTDGSMSKDENKGISSIAYNVLGKPLTVNFSSGKKIEYIYDAAGTKLTMKTYQGATVLTCTNYVGGFVYEGTSPALSFFSSPEGRVVKNGSNYEYQYAIADHQGNTRVVFTSATPTPQTLTATFEGDGSDNSNLFTNVSNVVPSGSANTTPGGNYVVRMNQSYKVGPSKSLRVYPGDKIDLEVRGYHENSNGYGNTTQALATMISAVASAFGGVSGGGGESGSIFSGVNSAFGAYGLGGSSDSQPAAYLNYILFDTNYKMLTMGWTRVPATPLVKHTLTLNNLNIKEAGYIFVYLSYESLSNNFVYFDDMKITHTRTNVVQYNEYYPFGLQTANSWTRENTTGNNFLGNGGTELNTTSNLYDLQFRNYDPILGRMNQVDPMSTKYASLTPYNFAFNDPVYFNDPSGADPYSTSAKDFYEDSRKEMYGTLWRDQMRSHGRVGDDDLFPRQGRGSTSSAMNDPGPQVYSRWCGCNVSAFEILRWDPKNQNAEFRMEAQRAVDTYLNKGIKQDATKMSSPFPDKGKESTLKSNEIGILDVLAAYDKLNDNKKFYKIPGRLSDFTSGAEIIKSTLDKKYWEAGQKSIKLGISVAFQYEYLVGMGFIEIVKSDAFQHKVLEGALSSYSIANQQVTNYLSVYYGSKDQRSDGAQSAFQAAERWASKRDEAERQAMSALYALTKRD